MKYEREIVLSETEKTFVMKCLEEKDMMGEDDTWSKTAVFDNGIEMDIKLCGSRDGVSWTEAVLFRNGSEVCCSEVSDEFFGEWSLEFNNDEYIVLVQ